MESGNRRNRGGWRRALHVAAWNAALLAGGLVLIAVVGEIHLRATRPFPGWSTPLHFVPDVGVVYQPGTEIHRTNHLDFWTVSRTNSLGFADREPVADRAATGCHVVMIGDSFVAALQVPVADKFHVRLEALARRELPHLDISTTAFGHGGFAPVNELAFWDRHARHLSLAGEATFRTHTGTGTATGIPPATGGPPSRCSNTCAPTRRSASPAPDRVKGVNRTRVDGQPESIYPCSKALR